MWTLYQCGGFDEALALELLAHPSEDVRTWTVRLLGDEGQVSPKVAERFVTLAHNEPSAVVRSQLACTAKLLPAGQGLPLVAALLTRDEDATDPHIPLLVWWAVEEKAVADREQVLQLLATSKAWSHPLTKEFVLPRLARCYAAGATAEDFVACARLLAAAPGEAEFDILIAGMEKGLAGRKLASVPPELAAVVEGLHVECESRPERIRFAIRLGSHAVLERALALIADSKVAQADRLALIEVVGQVGDPAAVGPLLKLLNDAEPAGIQTAARTALERFADPRIGAAVLALLPKTDSAVRTRALTLLCGRAATSELLLEAVDRGEIKPDQVPAAQLRQIALFKQPRIEELLTRHWGKVTEETPAEKRARIHGISVSMNLTTGDAVRGKPLFAKHCGICHTLFGEGNKIGPDLTGADRKNREFLLTSIVDPSAVIRKEFFNYNLATKDGRVLTGLIAESTPTTVTILDAKNQRTTVSQDDVDTLEPAPQSLMPEKILDELDADQVRDLMRYLQSDAPAQAATGAGQ